MVRLFDVENGKLVPTEHCYAIRTLKTVMDEYPECYLDVYKYCFYMSCHNEKLNPFANFPESTKEESILKEIEPDFSIDDDAVQACLEFCQQVFSTVSLRAYMGAKKAMDNLSDYLSDAEITAGRDGNITSVMNVIKNMDVLRQSFKNVYKDLQEEHKAQVYGKQDLAYDQM